MKAYFKRLKSHPGLGHAFFLTMMFIAAGLTNKSVSSINGLLIGVIVSVVFCWLPVLVSNRK